MARRPTVSDSTREEERGKSYDQQIIDEAKARFKRAQEWEGDFRKLYIEDVKFANGDSDNGWQWPDVIREQRDLAKRPRLTINKTKMHVLLLANEARQNPPQAKIKPVGEKVSYEAAQIWQGLIKHIQYVSNAQSVYITAKESQLEGGIGYWRVNHDFCDDRSFDQDVRLEPLDAMKVYLDCDIKRIDGSDSMWGFIFDDFDRKEFEKMHPNVPLPPSRSPSLDDKDDWIRKDGVRIAEYFRIKLNEDELLYLENGNDSWTGLRSEIPAPWRDQLDDYRIGKVGSDYKARKLMVRQLQWFKIAGNEIIDRNDGTGRKPPLKGKYIPIIRMVGRERVIQGRLYRAGLVRTIKDPQRLYNYNTSGEVEVVALQTKSPWLVAAAAIEGNEQAWANANTTNAAYLTFRYIDDEGNPIPPPQRLQPPTPAAGFMEGLRIAQAEMEMASGQYQAQQPNQTIERTPQAVNQRTRQSQLANYDFTDNEMQAVRHTAVVILDLAPHIYDRDRMLQIKADDGTIREIFVSPEQEESHKSEEQQGANKPEKVYFNPKIGRYAVEADVGPSYQTRREEAWDAFVEIVKSSPELMNIIGDLGFLAADFPMAEQIAERFRRHIEQTAPWLLKDSQTGPLLQKLQQQLQEAQAQIGELMEKLAEARVRSRGKEELRDIESQDADNKRLTAVADALKTLHEIGINQHELLNLLRKTEHDMRHDTASLEIERANQETVEGDESATQ